MPRSFYLSLLVLLCLVGVTRGDSPEDAARRGYRLLLEKAYVPAYFDQETFDNVWQAWPAALRAEAEKSSASERRQMAYQRYGLTERPGESDNKPLQFVVDSNGTWTPNCFTCHGGEVNGEAYAGSPNSNYALQTLIQETRLTKIRMGKSMATIDLGALVMPLGTTVGTTNAVIFGVALAADRDNDLNLIRNSKRPEFLHHDMDAPPWWHFRKKEFLYLDGFAPKDHRPLMQFALDPSNGPEKFREWEDEFRDIYAYLESLEPPRYPFSIDQALAARGRLSFERVCAECHGTYGAEESYPHHIVPIDEIGTDRARFEALTDHDRASYAHNWFSNYGEHPVVISPGGYMAPPLDGVWASAPYFHNGSVPTLWHVLRPDERPTVWKKDGRAFDRVRVGPKIASYQEAPSVRGAAERRRIFDTRKFGKSAAGHDYPNQLSDDEKIAVLEYLKTL